MKSRSFRLIVFGIVAAVAVGEIGARLIEPSLPELSAWPTLETQVKADQLDGLGELPEVLVVGSSVTESGVDPAQLIANGAAASAYNSAFPFYTPAALRVWLDDFIKPWGEVETLLIGLPAWPPPATPEEDNLTGALKELATQDSAPHPLSRFGLWRLRGVLTDLDEALHRERAIARGRFTELGHQTLWQDISGEVFGGHGDYGTPAMAEYQRDALEDIVAIARGSGTTPVLVIEPGRFAGRAADGDLEEYIASLMAFADKLGVELWDAYNIDWDPAFFADGTHFNSQGTEAYTRYLGQKLQETRAGS